MVPVPRDVFGFDTVVWSELHDDPPGPKLVDSVKKGDFFVSSAATPPRCSSSLRLGLGRLGPHRLMRGFATSWTAFSSSCLPHCVQLAGERRRSDSCRTCWWMLSEGDVLVCMVQSRRPGRWIGKADHLYLTWSIILEHFRNIADQWFCCPKRPPTFYCSRAVARRNDEVRKADASHCGKH